MAEGEEDDQTQKTEEPTPKRLEEARKKGQVPLSREINNWMMLFAATLLVAALSGGLFSELTNIMAYYIRQAHEIPYGQGGVAFALGEGFWHVFRAMVLPFLLLLFIAFIGPFAQVGPLLTAHTIKPELSKISPMKGFKRLFSMRSLVEFAKGILKIIVIGAVAFVILSPFFNAFEHLIDLTMIAFLDEMRMLVVRMMIGVLVVLAVIAAIDLIYQRNEHYKKMKMSKQELKDEYKQSEGDPHIKAKLRQLRSEKAKQRMMQAVPEADVVITNPTHYSIALKYKPDSMEAPECIAKGINETALRIREVAKENNIELFENRPLARALYDSVEIDETIPAEHFKAVAEIISFVFQKRKPA